MLAVAIAISVLMHVGAFWWWAEMRQKPERMSSPSLEILLRLPAPKPAPAALPEDPQPVIESSPPAPAEPLIDEAPVTSAPLEAVVLPAPRMSIQQRIDDYVANLPLSAEYLPDNTQAEPDNIFHPKLREALREQGGRSSDSLGSLNDSTMADAYERVSLDGKCFRLEDLGGGGDRRAWYPVKCKGGESTSDAMARGLEAALEHR